MKCHLCENDTSTGIYIKGNVLYLLCDKCQEYSEDEILTKLGEKRDAK